MAFDRDAARAAGYSDAEIDAYLRQQGEPAPVNAAPAAAPAVSGFDREAARAAGYTDQEIDQFLNTGTESEASTSDGADTTLLGTMAQATLPAAMRGPVGIKPETVKAVAAPVKGVAMDYITKPKRVALDVGLMAFGAPPVAALLTGGERIKQGVEAAQATKEAASKAVSATPRDIDAITGKQTAPAVQRAYDGLYQKIKVIAPGREAELTQAYAREGNNGVKKWLAANQDLITSDAKLTQAANKLSSELPSTIRQAGRAAAPVAKFAAKYALGPAALALSAADIAQAAGRGDYGDAAAQTALTGIGLIPGVGAPLAAGLSVPYYYGRQAYLNRNQRPQTSEPDVTQQIYGP